MLRKIDLEMSKAVRNRVPFFKDNTEVRVSGSGFTASVYLFGNDIARIIGPWIIFAKQCVEIDEWKTATTKRRINALLHEFVPSLGLYQSKNKWYFSRSFSYDLLWESSHLAINLDEKFIRINHIRYPYTTQLSGEVA